MFKKFNFSNKSSKEQEIDSILTDISKICKSIHVETEEFSDLNLCNYKYETKEAMEELGLDQELVDQLLEDYVSQILNNITAFKSYIEELKKVNTGNREVKKLRESDYTQLRELAHKNLGVARNLRIRDAEKLLKFLHKSDNIEHLIIAVHLLEACAIKLKPNCAYNVLNLMKIKNSF
jgi:HPt (histidine-containing phosphotransfer) domain-containing protein